MRYLTIALLAATATFLTIESANSQTAGSANPQTADHPAPAANVAANRSESSDDVSRWQEPRGYRPCPADVVLANGRHACLGLPD